MNVLLDSHILIWALSDDDRLPPSARRILLDGEDAIYYSAASIWELAVKHALHPESVALTPSEFLSLCKKAGYIELPVYASHARLLDSLTRSEGAPRHKDHFDRMLIAQAKSEGMAFLTHDNLLPYLTV